mgnify:CR=1 FL=1
MKQATAPAVSNIDADRHNFGVRVEKVERACGTWFRKPRTTHWEWLFFGKESPLRPHFAVIGANGTLLSDYIFNLDVEQNELWLGHSRNVPDEDGPLISHFYSFGILLAYTYVFGIRDLHCGNLVVTPTHLQVVDVEVVLAHLVLPHETVLLPFKQVTWQRAGVRKLISSPEQISATQAKALLSGYLDLFTLVMEKRDDILSALNASIDLRNPVRVLLRNTVEYIPESGATMKYGLLPEEVQQLNRGDVPYFFKMIGAPDLLWIQSPNQYAKVESLSAFESDVVRHALQPDILLSEKLVSPLRMAQGLFLILQKFNLKDTFSFGDSTMVSGDKIVFRSISYKAANR